MDSGFFEDDKSSGDGIVYYNMWYNEQRSRMFTKADQNLSFDACFQRVHKYITEDSKFIAWCERYQKGVITYVPGSNGAAILPITYILNNYIKSLMGLPFYKMGNFEDWTVSKSAVIKEIAVFASSPKPERYMLVRKLMIEALIPVFQGFHFRDLLINAFVTVYHSETNMQVFLHNSYPNFGKGFESSARLANIGQPNSTAFGLGQWLGSRLLDYYYFVADKLSLLTDPRQIGPEILYHPSFQVAFMAFELRKGGYYNKVLLKRINKWHNNNITPTYQDMVELVLEGMQGIEPTDKQFASSFKIKQEKRTVNQLPKEFSTSHTLTKLI